MKIKKTGKRILSCLMAFALIVTTCLFAGMPISPLRFKAKAANTDGKLCVDEDGNFTVLQVADMQGCYPLPDQWLNALRLAISMTEPDLIVMTGDNVEGAGTENAFKNTVDQIISEFYTYVKDGVYYSEKHNIPYVVTFGNHDYESNNNLSLQTQWDYYHDNSINNAIAFSETISGVPLGNGCVNIYDHDGNNIVERVIVLNSGSYENGGYAKPGYSQETTNTDYGYSTIVSKVNSWTNNTSIKCISFQHIPLQEFYLGDSDATRILKPASSQVDNSYLPVHTGINNTDITGNNYYAPNYTTNPTVKGIFTETCCCSYSSTRDLYNALAGKNNVYGIFYGHDHGNTLYGVSTVGGKSLRQGYGGGLNTRYNGSGSSMFSYYVLNKDYSGINDSQNFQKTGDTYAKYLDSIGGAYGPKTYAPNSVSYVSEVGADYSPHNIFQKKKWERAVDNVVDSGLVNPIKRMANNTDANADLNRGCGGDTDYVCVGYNTSTDPQKAITGIIGYRTESSDHPSTITVKLQDGTDVEYVLDRNNTDCSGGISKYYTLIYYTRNPKVGPPVTNLYVTYEANDMCWGGYGRGSDTITKPYRADNMVEMGEDGNWHLNEWQPFDYNTGCGSSTPYIYITYSSTATGVEDVTRAYYDFFIVYNKYKGVNNDLGIYTDDSYSAYKKAEDIVKANLDFMASGYSELTNAQIENFTKNFYNAYNNLTLAPVAAGRQVTVPSQSDLDIDDDADFDTDYYVAVPDTIYLEPTTYGSAYNAQHFLNNKIDDDGKVVPDDEAYSSTGKFELRCDSASSVKVTAVRMKKQTGTTPFKFDVEGSSTYYYDSDSFHLAYEKPDIDLIYSSGVTFDTTESGGYDVITGSIDALWLTVNNKNENALAPGETGMIEWRFEVTKSDNVKEMVYAYTTIYSPFLRAAAAIGQATFHYHDSYRSGTTSTAIFGLHEIVQSHFTSFYLGTSSQSYGDWENTGVYKYNLATYTTLPAAHTDINTKPNALMESYDQTKSEDSKSGCSTWHTDSHGETANVAGGIGKIYVDSSRTKKIGDIPNFHMYAYLNGMNSTSDVDTGNYNAYYTKENTSTLVNFANGSYISTSTKKLDPDASSLIGTTDNRVSQQSIENNMSLLVNVDWAMRRKSGGTEHSRTASKVVFTTTDKSSIRESIGECQQLSPQLSWVKNTAVEGGGTIFSNYMQSLVNASYALGNPTSTSVSTEKSTLETNFSAVKNDQKRAAEDAETKFYTTETNFGLVGILNNYGQTTGYIVNEILVDTYKFEGNLDPETNQPKGIGTRERVYVQPYEITYNNYSYCKWANGVSAPKLGATIPKADYENAEKLFTTFDPDNKTFFGHITQETLDGKYNDFNFYYRKANRTLTFDMNGGSWNGYTDTNYTVEASQDDSFTVGIVPTRSGYVFMGWELTTPGGARFNKNTNNFVFGTGDSTLTAQWRKIITLHIDSTDGHTTNNLMYFNEGRDSLVQIGKNISVDASYEGDSEITITGRNTGVGSENTIQVENLRAYLVKDHTYKISWNCTNNLIDFYAYKTGTGMNCRSGRMIKYAQKDPETNLYKSEIVFTVGGTGDDSPSDRTWNNSTYYNNTYQLTSEYSFRLSFNKNLPTGDYTVSDLRVEEVTEGAGDDNRIVGIESMGRFLQNPEDLGGKIFGGWEVYSINSDGTWGNMLCKTYNRTAADDANIGKYLTAVNGGYRFIYQDTDIGLKAHWITPVGVAFDNMFNIYEWWFAPNVYNNGAISADQKTAGDKFTFDSEALSLNCKSDGEGDEVYSPFGGSAPHAYYMSVYKYKDTDGVEKKAQYYQLTFDVTVNAGKANLLLLHYKTNDSWSYEHIDEYNFTKSEHYSTVINVADDINYLTFRFGVKGANNDVTFSNIRLVPISASTVENDTFGFAENSSMEDRITPPTATYNVLSGEVLGRDVYKPTRKGNDFIGWQYTDTDGTKKAFTATTPAPEHSINVWSQWEVHYYQTFFNNNDGTGNVSNALSVSSYSASTHKFTEKPSGRIYTNTSTVSGKTNNFTVDYDRETGIFNFNGKLYGSTSQMFYSVLPENIESGKTYRYKITVIGGSHTVTNSDALVFDFMDDNGNQLASRSHVQYSFKNKGYWGDYQDGSVGNSCVIRDYDVANAYGINIWVWYHDGANNGAPIEFNNYRIKIEFIEGNSDNVNPSPNSKYLPYYSQLGTMPVPVRPGYEFVSWNTKADGSGTTYTATSRQPAENITLYAQWEAADLKLWYDNLFNFDDYYQSIVSAKTKVSSSVDDRTYSTDDYVWADPTKGELYMQFGNVSSPATRTSFLNPESAYYIKVKSGTEYVLNWRQISSSVMNNNIDAYIAFWKADKTTQVDVGEYEHYGTDNVDGVNINGNPLVYDSYYVKYNIRTGPSDQSTPRNWAYGYSYDRLSNNSVYSGAFMTDVGVSTANTWSAYEDRMDVYFTVPEGVEYITLGFGINDGDASSGIFNNSRIGLKDIYLAAVSSPDGIAYDEFVEEQHVQYDKRYSTYTIEDSSFSVSCTPQRYGYNLIGWYSDVACTNAFPGALKPADYPYGINAYSKWSNNEFTLCYDQGEYHTGDTITGMPGNATLIYDTETKASRDGVISSSIPTGSNSVFCGWFDNDDNTFYPGNDIPRSVVNRWYKEAQDSNAPKAKHLVAQWVDISTGNAKKNIENPESSIVRGIEIDDNGLYKSILYKMKGDEREKYTKYDSSTYGDYTSAQTSFEGAVSDALSTVDKDTRETVENARDNIIAKAEALNSAKQDVVNTYYKDGFYIKNSSGSEKKYTLADMNLNHYSDTSLANAMKAKKDGKTAAYSSYTDDSHYTLRKAFDSVGNVTAQSALNTAVRKMATEFAEEEQIDSTPEFNIYETTDALKKLGIEATGVNNVVADTGAHAYYLYTNIKNPKVVIDVDDVVGSADHACYPTTATTPQDISNPPGALFGTRDVVSNYLKDGIYSAYLEAGMGTDKGAEYYNKKAEITITPTFNTDKETVTYVFTATNDSKALTSAKKSSLKSGNDIAKQETMNDTQIKIIICYKSDGGFDVTYDQYGAGYDFWINQFHLYRTSGGASNWEIPGWDSDSINDKDKNTFNKPINRYKIVDEDYTDANYCSFTYTFTAKMINDFVTNTKAADKEYSKTFAWPSVDDPRVHVEGNMSDKAVKDYEDALNSTDTDNLEIVHDFINAKVKSAGSFLGAVDADRYVAYNKAKNTTGTGFNIWAGSGSWSANYYPPSKAYIYVHLIDRWGNVVDKIIPCPNLDSEASTASVETSVITESGGSGLNTVSLGTSIEIIPDKYSILEGNVYTSVDNTVTLYTGSANKSYTVTMEDHAGNKSTGKLKTDENGYIDLTIEDKDYTDGVYTFTLNGYTINLYDGITNNGKVVNVQYVPTVGVKNTYKVKVSDRATMIQFIELGSGDGTGTRSFDRYHSKVESIVSYNAKDEEVQDTSRDLSYEIWTLTIPLGDGLTGVRVKTAGSSKWEDKSLAYRFYNQYKTADSMIISVDLERYSGAPGGINYTAVTGGDVQAIQFKKADGDTNTRYAEKAEKNNDGTLTFKGKVWFNMTGEQTAVVRILDAYGWHDATTVTYTVN